MQNDIDRDHATLKLASVHPPRDMREAPGSEATRAAERASGAFGSLRRWLLRTHLPRPDRDMEPLDDHTLNDIGMTRFEIVYWIRK